jgi:hypothetical protein
VDDLVVNDELTTTIVDDQSTDTTAALRESLANLAEKLTLGDDGEGLLDITSLGHGGEGAILVEVQNAVGLVDGTKHGLNDNRGGGVGDEAGLLLQLTGEEVDTQVAVLAGLGGDGDPDHLAGATLENQDVADADEVAGDGDGFCSGLAGAGLDDANSLTDAITVTNWATFVSDDYFLTIVVMMVVVEWMRDAVDSTLHATAEGVVVTVVVVVTHLASRGLVDSGVRLEDLDLRDRSDGGRTRRNRLYSKLAAAEGVSLACFERLRSVGLVVGDVDLGLGSLERDVGSLLGLVGLVRVYGSLVTTVRNVDVVSRVGTATILSLSDVKLGLKGLVVDGLGR